MNLTDEKLHTTVLLAVHSVLNDNYQFCRHDAKSFAQEFGQVASEMKNVLCEYIDAQTQAYIETVKKYWLSTEPSADICHNDTHALQGPHCNCTFARDIAEINAGVQRIIEIINPPPRATGGMTFKTLPQNQ